MPFTSADLTATLNQAGVSNYHTAGQGGRPTTVAVGRTARYVRAQLAGTNYLSLAEIEVMAAASAVSSGASSPLTAAAAEQSEAPTAALRRRLFGRRRNG